MKKITSFATSLWPHSKQAQPSAEQRGRRFDTFPVPLRDLSPGIEGLPRSGSRTATRFDGQQKATGGLLQDNVGTRSSPLTGEASLTPLAGVLTAELRVSERTFTSPCGKLTIVCHGKKKDEKRIKFSLNFHPSQLVGKKSTKIKKSDPVSFEHTLCIYERNKSFETEPTTLSYDDIDIPEAMRGKGVSYLYHAEAARVAAEIGIELFSVENVVNEYLQHGCSKSGMVPDEKYAKHVNYYIGKVDVIQEKCRRNASAKGWYGDSFSG